MSKLGIKLIRAAKEAVAFVRGEDTGAKVTVWTVDRDGRVRKPERMIVLRARPTRSRT